MEKTSHKMKQFLVNQNTAYLINNKNKVYHWGDSFLNFKEFDRNKVDQAVVKGKIVALSLGIKNTLGKKRKKRYGL